MRINCVVWQYNYWREKVKIINGTEWVMRFVAFLNM